MKPFITNYRECDAGAWLKAMAETEGEPDVETFATPIPSLIRLQVTRSTSLPTLVTRESLVSVGREAAEVDAVGVDTAGERRPGEAVEVVK